MFSTFNVAVEPWVATAASWLGTWPLPRYRVGRPDRCPPFCVARLLADSLAAARHLGLAALGLHSPLLLSCYPAPSWPSHSRK